MDDLKKLSVERLRELARKHLGKGHSRFRTRAELLAALKEALRELPSRLLDAAESVVPHARENIGVVDFPPGRKGRVRTERTTPAADASAASPQAPAAREPQARPGPPRAESSSASPRAPVGREGAGRTRGPRKEARPATPRLALKHL